MGCQEKSEDYRKYFVAAVGDHAFTPWEIPAQGADMAPELILFA
jgi:hypothetical protein